MTVPAQPGEPARPAANQGAVPPLPGAVPPLPGTVPAQVGGDVTATASGRPDGFAAEIAAAVRFERSLVPRALVVLALLAVVLVLRAVLTG